MSKRPALRPSVPIHSILVYLARQGHLFPAGQAISLGSVSYTHLLAFNFGDGFGNYIFPTSTALMGLIGAANIPYDRWMRFIGKIFLVWVVIGCILVAIAQFIHLA